MGALSQLAIGLSRDKKETRAILHFDTASLPDNATITRAYLEIQYHAQSGDVWMGGTTMSVDVQKGYFSSSQALQADDWGARATAERVARIEPFSAGAKPSSDFSPAGLAAINKTGVTQIRLRMEPPPTSPNNYLFIKGGANAKLFVEYAV